MAKTAAEEIGRWVSPTKVFRRAAVTDVDLGGQPHFCVGKHLAVLEIELMFRRW